MKRILIITLAAVLVLVLASCASAINIDSLSENNVDGFEKTEYTDLPDVGITMSIKDQTVTTKTESITIDYANATDTEYTYGIKPHLEIASDADWYVIPFEEGWEDFGIILPPHGTSEYGFSFVDYYEGLKPGHYRIIKTFYADGNSVNAAVEFDIIDSDS